MNIFELLDNSRLGFFGLIAWMVSGIGLVIGVDELSTDLSNFIGFSVLNFEACILWNFL